jgi:Tol biopolymer transport system component
MVWLAAVALSVNLRCPSPVAARSTAAQFAVVVPPTTVHMLTGTLMAVNNGPGNQTNPHVNCDRVSYTNDDLEGSSTIHYFDFSTGADNVIPGNTLDRLSDLSGTHIAFTELTALGDRIVVFDTTTQTSTVVPGSRCSNPALGGNLVAFEDRSTQNQSEVDLYDLSTGTVTALTNDALFDKNPAVSPTGNAIVWEKCQTDGGGCNIYAATQTSPGVFTTRALTGSADEDRIADTNGEIVVYTSTRGGEADIYYQPVGGGTETQISIPGEQRDVSISGNLIAFESQTATGYDVFVYDLSTGNLYQVTNTPSIDETLSDISVCNGIGRIVYAIPGAGAFDIYAFTFQLPSSVPAQVNDLIALVRSFNLPAGTENSLTTKLQDALAALAASDMATACTSLGAFINECSAQSGKKLTVEQASQLIDAATRVSTALGCQ